MSRKQKRQRAIISEIWFWSICNLIINCPPRTKNGPPSLPSESRLQESWFKAPSWQNTPQIVLVFQRVGWIRWDYANYVVLYAWGVRGHSDSVLKCPSIRKTYLDHGQVSFQGWACWDAQQSSAWNLDCLCSEWSRPRCGFEISPDDRDKRELKRSLYKSGGSAGLFRPTMLLSGLSKQWWWVWKFRWRRRKQRFIIK